MHLPVESSVDQILSQLIPTGPSRKVLFWGEGAGEMSSYVAGWMAGQAIDVIVLDGANRFDPYMVSSFAKKVSLLPEHLLKRIRIARAFTCYQMATLVEEKLASLLQQEGSIARPHKPWVILLGPISTFSDEDVPDREVRPLFERSLKRIEAMAMEGVSFFLFQPWIFSDNPPTPPLVKRGKGGLMESRRAYLTRRVFQISDMVWKICLDDQGPKMILEKGLRELQIADRRLQIEQI